MDQIHPMASVPPPTPARETYRFDFTGTAPEYFRVWIVNVALTIVTLGIYSAWAKVRNRQYFYGNSRIAGGSFEYTANPVNILKGRLLVLGVLIAYQAASTFQPLLALGLAVILIPLVPWGLREASIVTALIYGAVTLSTLTSKSSFDLETLWTLQLVMVGAGVVSLVLVARNVTVRKDDIRKRFDLERANHKILLLSNKDALTGAWNRRYLKSEFPKRVAEWREQAKTFQFAFLDLDDFKPLNDTYGHDCGDKVLLWTTEVFNQLLQDNGCLVRMGGDEFSLLFASDNPESLLEQGAREIRLRAAGDAQFSCAEIGLSVGIVSVDPGLDVTQSAIYKRADEALYEAKSVKGTNADGLNLVHYGWCANGESRRLAAGDGI